MEMLRRPAPDAIFPSRPGSAKMDLPGRLHGAIWGCRRSQASGRIGGIAWGYCLNSAKIIPHRAAVILTFEISNRPEL